MRGVHRTAWILFTLLLSLAVESGCIHGTIVDSHDYPMRHLEVQLTDLETGRVMVGRTNDDGKFLFFPALDGRYRITASRYAYCDLEASFEKREDTYLLKDAVMSNRSSVKVHRFNPPSLAPMRDIAPDIATREFTIYLPPSYGVMEDRRYPVIYLLHGNTQNHLSYFGTYSGGFGLNLQSVLDELVSPNGYKEFILPHSGDVEPLMVRYLKEPDLQELIDVRLVSMAPSLDGEHYPDNEFPIFLGPEGEVLMTMVEDPENPEGPEVELWSNFYLRNDPCTYLAENPEAIEGLSFYIDSGERDEFQLFENNSAFSALLADLGLEPSLDIGPANRHFFEIYPSLSHVDHITFHRIRKALEFLLNHLKG